MGSPLMWCKQRAGVSIPSREKLIHNEVAAEEVSKQIQNSDFIKRRCG